MSDAPKLNLNNFIVPESVDNAIKNATDEPTKEIGSVLSDLFYLIFGGIHFQADKWRAKREYALSEFKKSLEKKVNKIPEDKCAELDMQVVATALEDAKFCIENETVREMFANLLASSLDSDKSSSVHPSFSSIIKQMSPLEARIFIRLEPQKTYPICELYSLKNNIWSGLFTNVLLADNEVINLIDLRMRSVAITSLNRLGLLHLSYDQKTENSLYSRYLQNNAFIYLTKHYEKLGETVDIKRGIVGLNPFGQDLWTTCCKDIKPETIDDFPQSFL